MVVSMFKKLQGKKITNNLTENVNNFPKGANSQIVIAILSAVLKNCLKNELLSNTIKFQNVLICNHTWFCYSITI